MHEDAKEKKKQSNGGFLFSVQSVQVFEDLQKMLNLSENQPQSWTTHSKPATIFQLGGTVIQTHPLFRVVLGLCVALATVSIGLYAL